MILDRLDSKLSESRARSLFCALRRRRLARNASARRSRSTWPSPVPLDMPLPEPILDFGSFTLDTLINSFQNSSYGFLAVGIRTETRPIPESHTSKSTIDLRFSSHLQPRGDNVLDRLSGLPYSNLSIEKLANRWREMSGCCHENRSSASISLQIKATPRLRGMRNLSAFKETQFSHNLAAPLIFDSRRRLIEKQTIWLGLLFPGTSKITIFGQV